MRPTVKVSVLGLITIACVAAVIAHDRMGATQNAAATVTADTRIPRNSKVYIAPMEGFETLNTSAFWETTNTPGLLCV